MLQSGIEFSHPDLGIVHIVVRPNSCHISARWRDGKVYLNVPRGLRYEDISPVLEEMKPRLLDNKPDLLYYDGQQIDFDGLSVVIQRQWHSPAKILAQAHLPVSSIEVGSDWDFNNGKTSQAISGYLCRIAQRLASAVILPRARMLAQEVNALPMGWRISSGHRVLGQCNTSGIISLSYMLVFLPMHLRDYIIYHELAHLSEMNHSPRFHALCDAYCSGNESRYIRELNSFHWPVLR